MTKDEKEAMRDGFNLCLTKIEQQKIVIGKTLEQQLSIMISQKAWQ